MAEILPTDGNSPEVPPAEVVPAESVPPAIASDAASAELATRPPYAPPPGMHFAEIARFDTPYGQIIRKMLVPDAETADAPSAPSPAETVPAAPELPAVEIQEKSLVVRREQGVVTGMQALVAGFEPEGRESWRLFISRTLNMVVPEEAYQASRRAAGGKGTYYKGPRSFITHDNFPRFADPLRVAISQLAEADRKAAESLLSDVTTLLEAEKQAESRNKAY